VSAATWLDAASPNEATEALVRCCGARRWVEGMLSRRPFEDDTNLHQVADQVWATMDRVDVLEALSHHPRIGADVEALRRKFAQTAAWSEGEQAGVSAASSQTLEALRDGNIAYEERFGFIFVVCATGKTAEEMLALLDARLPNDPSDEWRIAAAEQGKITHLRLEKLP